MKEFNKGKFLQWKNKVGRQEAAKRLVLAGAGIDSVIQWLSGNISKKPRKDTIKVLRKAMK